MEWRDEGVLLSVRLHGESAAIIEVFTAHHGRHAGVVRGGASRRMSPLLQPGTQLDVTWRARLEAHLGSYTTEPLRSRAVLMEDRGKLAALNSLCAILRLVLPERDPHPELYSNTIALLDAMPDQHDWPALYLNWERALLDEIGFGLDLTSCAVTGTTADLAYVSPKTGRAVSRAGAGEWADRLMPLPASLIGGPAGPEDLAQGLAVTGHFLSRSIEARGDALPLPEARTRLVSLLAAIA